MFEVVPESTVSSAQGRDVSNYQPVQSVSSWAPYQFGFAKATEGLTFKDAMFAGNWANMRAARIHRGAYHFFHPALDPVAQAKYFVSTVESQGLLPGDMLVADVEITSGGKLSRLLGSLRGKVYRNNLTQKVVSLATVNVAAKAFLDEVRTLVGSKYPVIVYSDLSVGSQLVSCTGYPLWIAWPSNSAPSNVHPWSKWTFWQWGAIGGIDRDAFNGTAVDLNNWINSYANPAPSGPPYVHYTVSGDTINGLAQSRGNEPPEQLIATQIQYYSATDKNNLFNVKLPAGIKWYTFNP